MHVVPCDNWLKKNEKEERGLVRERVIHATTEFNACKIFRAVFARPSGKDWLAAR
jgi:hypothetical protein